MKTHSLFIFVTLTLALAIDTGCRSRPPVRPLCRMVPIPVSLLPTDQRETVWFPDQIAPYTIGRYVDPRDPNVLHEAHTLYRREQTSRPNFTPPAALVLPPAGSPSASTTTIMLRDALTAELNEQRATSRVLVNQVQSLDQLLRTLNARTQEFRDAVRESTLVRAQLQAVSNRLEVIEGRLQVEKQQPASPGTSVPSKPPITLP